MKALHAGQSESKFVVEEKERKKEIGREILRGKEESDGIAVDHQRRPRIEGRGRLSVGVSRIF